MTCEVPGCSRTGLFWSAGWRVRICAHHKDDHRFTLLAAASKAGRVNHTKEGRP